MVPPNGSGGVEWKGEINDKICKDTLPHIHAYEKWPPESFA